MGTYFLGKSENVEIISEDSIERDVRFWKTLDISS